MPRKPALAPCQLYGETRRQYLRCLVYSMCYRGKKRDRTLVRMLTNLFEGVAKKTFDKKAPLEFARSYLGRKAFEACEAAAAMEVEEALMANRKMAETAAPRCDACLTYSPQLLCYVCNTAAFKRSLLPKREVEPRLLSRAMAPRLCVGCAGCDCRFCEDEVSIFSEPPADRVGAQPARA